MMSKTGNKNGFTLIEVLLASMILGVGTLLIQHGLLKSAELHGRYRHSLVAQLWLQESYWEFKESLLYTDEPLYGTQEGIFEAEHKQYRWSRSLESSSGRGLYAISNSVEWDEGNKPFVDQDYSLVYLPQKKT